MEETSLKITLKNIPHQAGVYRFYSSNSTLLYIGKAKNLHKRVGSYFQKSKTHNARTRRMVSQIERIEYTIVESEKQSILLESNLISSLQPKYNVLLKNEKNYTYVRITNDPIPTIELVRRKYDHKSTYFGPYVNRYAILATLRSLRQVFPYCQERYPRSRACAYYGIKQCDGICIDLETMDHYNKKLDQIKRVLEGKTDEVDAWINQRIAQSLNDQRYDLAAMWRDRKNLLNSVVGEKKHYLSQSESINLLALVIYFDNEGMVIGSFFLQTIVDGKVVNNYNSILSGTPDQEGDRKSNPDYSTGVVEEFIKRYLQSFGTHQTSTIPYIIKAYTLNEDSELTAITDNKDFKRISQPIICSPKARSLISSITGIDYKTSPKFKSNKKIITQLLEQNALNAFNYLLRNKNQEKLNLFEENNLFTTLVNLQKLLNLKKIPKIIECYDISHISGKFVYGSMVTFVDGRSSKNKYKLFKTKEQNNDFENMKSVLSRRIRRFYEAESDFAKLNWQKPDLIIIDGGKGQLNSVVDCVNSINKELANKNICFDSEICSLAKKEELVYFPDSPTSIQLSGEPKFLIQRIRDEAHRFAITNNRKARLKTATKSKIEDIPGIGEKTKIKILKEFGSINGLIEALDTNREFVIEILGQNITNKLIAHYAII